MKRKSHKQILAELLRRNPSSTAAFRDSNTDIEDAIEAAGGNRGKINRVGVN